MGTTFLTITPLQITVVVFMLVRNVTQIIYLIIMFLIMTVALNSALGQVIIIS